MAAKDERESDNLRFLIGDAKLLSENCIYTDIAERTGLSTATISRVNRCLKYGADGYVTVLNRMKNEGEEA